VEVRSIDKNWSGSLHIGLTSNLPPSDKRRLPEIATQLKDVWIASGTTSSSVGNKLTKDKFKYISVLSKIQVSFIHAHARTHARVHAHTRTHIRRCVYICSV